MSHFKKNIVLIGYRGVGKSYTSQKLQEMLKMEIFSSDEVFTKKTGLSIADFVKTSGWEAFRKIESEIIEELSKKEGIIIDCGGGVVEKEINMNHLKKGGLIFYLLAEINEIIERIKLSNPRPSLVKNISLEEETKLMLSKRMPLYETHNHYAIDTSGLKIFDAHKVIASLYQEDQKYA